MLYLTHSPQKHTAWNEGKLIGQKPALKLKEVWAIRTRLQMAHKTRDLAMFNLAIDSKLRSCDLVKLQVLDVAHGRQILKRAMILQHNTQQPVQFELSTQTRKALSTWIQQANLNSGDFLFKSRRKLAAHLRAKMPSLLPARSPSVRRLSHTASTTIDDPPRRSPFPALSVIVCLPWESCVCTTAP